MKKVFLLMALLCGVVRAEDMAMNCTQQGFQVGLGFGEGISGSTCTPADFKGAENTPATISTNLQNIVEPSQFLITDDAGAVTFDDPGSIDITTVALDYSNISTWQSTPAIMASFSLGYKTFFDCNKYSVTGNAFIMMNGTSMTSNLQAESASFQVQVVDNANAEEGEETTEETVETVLIGGIGNAKQYAGKMKLTSGAIFGFSVLLAKEFSWGNAGLLLGMKFNPYKLTYLETKPQNVTEGVVTTAGYLDISGEENNNVNLDITDYTYNKSKTKTATGFTVGFATNYYIADNVSAGLTVFYDMYAPISFDLQDINICPYTYGDEPQATDSGKIKFQNNTIGVMMNLTYSFGAN